MKISHKIRKKRGYLTVLVLLIGVTFAGMVSTILGNPIGENDYLHEHLPDGEIQSNLNWKSLDFDLSEQDKAKISKIITQAERPMSIERLKKTMTDQALAEAQDNICESNRLICNFPIRVNRQLSALHINQDMRVVSVQEISRRVNLKVKSGMLDLELNDLADETRVLGFYQTQAGWVQNRSAIIKTKPVLLGARGDQFRARFAKPYVGLNYYPASASWAKFWEQFPREEIENDLERAKALNVNALRIFLTHSYFDSEGTREDGLSKLEAFLDICEAQNLVVLVTLFDLRPDYRPLNWEADIGHIDMVLSRISKHKAVLGIDLKNQPDLDFGTWGQGHVETWLTVMARHIQTHYQHLPVTAGWSQSEHATRLKDVFDFVTYHEYESPKNFETRLRDVRTAVGDKPVMITELGSTIWHPPFINSIRERKQASRLDHQLKQAGQAKGVFVWTLNDFETVSRDVVGPLPWRRAQQKHFGLIREDGTFRPAADILKSFGASALVQTETPPLQPNSIQHSPL